MVVIPGTVNVRVPVLVVCDVIVPVGPTGEVEFEKEDGETGEPSVEDVLPPVGTGTVIVYVVPVEMVVMLLDTDALLETPVGPGKLDVLLLPVTGAMGVELETVPYPGTLWVPVRGRLEIGNGG